MLGTHSRSAVHYLWLSSNDEGDWCTSEVDRNHEALEQPHQDSSNQCHHAGDEHGDDKGAPFVSEFDLRPNQMQAGIMEEMLDDTLEGLDEDPELEEEAEQEVDRVLYEITDGKLGVPGAGKELPVRNELFPVVQCCILICVTESQRYRGGSGERSGDGTDAGSAEQSAEWIIDALRAGCTRIFNTRPQLFIFLFTLAALYFSSYRKPWPTLSSIHRPTGNAAHSLVRSCRQERPSS